MSPRQARHHRGLDPARDRRIRAPHAPRRGDAAGQTSFLPANAQSTEVIVDLQTEFSGGDDVPALIVFSRDGGLTKQDKRVIGATSAGLEKLGIPGGGTVFDPLSPEARELTRPGSPAAADVHAAIGKQGPISKDGEAALVAVEINADVRNAISTGVADIREYLAANSVPGLDAHVTGPAGSRGRSEEIADDAGKTLLIATSASS